MSRVVVGDEVLSAGFLRDLTERRRRQEEREELLRAQAARAEAERVAEMVSGMQLLVDAALAHRALDEIAGRPGDAACATCSAPTRRRSS